MFHHLDLLYEAKLLLKQVLCFQRTHYSKNRVVLLPKKAKKFLSIFQYFKEFCFRKIQQRFAVTAYTADNSLFQRVVSFSETLGSWIRRLVMPVLAM